MHNTRPLTFLIATAALLTGCHTTPTAPATPPLSNIGLNRAPIEFPTKLPQQDGFTQDVFQAGPVLIAGQPSEAALTRLSKEGVTLVVNIRTPEEMNDRKRVPFDETDVLKRLNIDYVFIPLGGANNAYPYTPAAVDAFANALAHHTDGKVLLHCQVGWRASHLWAAYLVRYHAFTPEEALRHGRAMLVTDLPFEGLAGLKAEYAPRPHR